MLNSSQPLTKAAFSWMKIPILASKPAKLDFLIRAPAGSKHLAPVETT